MIYHSLKLRLLVKSILDHCEALNIILNIKFPLMLPRISPILILRKSIFEQLVILPINGLSNVMLNIQYSWNKALNISKSFICKRGLLNSEYVNIH